MSGPFDFETYKKRVDDARKLAVREEAARVERVGLIVEVLKNGAIRELNGTGMHVVDGKGWIRVSYNLGLGEKNLTIFVRDKDKYELAYNVQNPSKETGRSATEDEIMQAVIDWPQKLADDEIDELTGDDR